MALLGPIRAESTSSCTSSAFFTGFSTQRRHTASMANARPITSVSAEKLAASCSPMGSRAAHSKSSFPRGIRAMAKLPKTVYTARLHRRPSSTMAKNPMPSTRASAMPSACGIYKRFTPVAETRAVTGVSAVCGPTRSARCSAMRL